MVRACGQNLLTLLRQNTRPLDPASARKGSMCVYIWRCPRPHYSQRYLFAVHAVCDRAKAHSFAVFCLLALFMILVSTRSTARRTRRRVMSAAVAQIETSAFYACKIYLCRARYLFHSVGGLCLLQRYAAKPQKRSDAKTHGFIFIDGAFCVWQNIIRLYYAVTRQNSGVQLSAARKPDECALVKR